MFHDKDISWPVSIFRNERNAPCLVQAVFKVLVERSSRESGKRPARGLINRLPSQRARENEPLRSGTVADEKVVIQALSESGRQKLFLFSAD
jgi:hypothetical protein